MVWFVLAFIAIVVFLFIMRRIAKNEEHTGGNSSFVDDSVDFWSPYHPFYWTLNHPYFVSPFHPQKHLVESKPYEDDCDIARATYDPSCPLYWVLNDDKNSCSDNLLSSWSDGCDSSFSFWDSGSSWSSWDSGSSWSDSWSSGSSSWD